MSQDKGPTRKQPSLATDEDGKHAPPPGSSGEAGALTEYAQNDTEREGPPRLSPSLDRHDKWEKSAAHPGFQKGDQGGYRASYDDTKFESVEPGHYQPAESRVPPARASTDSADDSSQASPKQTGKAAQKRGTPEKK